MIKEDGWDYIAGGEGEQEARCALSSVASCFAGILK